MGVFDARIFWPDLARDLVYLTLPNLSPDKPATLDVVKDAYGLDDAGLNAIVDQPDFQAVLRRERDRAKALGPRAGHVYRTEAMIADLSEKIYARARSGGERLDEVVKAYVALARTAGIDEPADRRDRSGGATTNIQINVPNLANPKLSHINGV
jgi:hypothetical protein